MLEDDKLCEENNKARKRSKNDRYQCAGSKGCNLKECLLKTSMNFFFFFFGGETNKGSEQKGKKQANKNKQKKKPTCVDFWEKSISLK